MKRNKNEKKQMIILYLRLQALPGAAIGRLTRSSIESDGGVAGGEAC